MWRFLLKISFVFGLMALLVQCGVSENRPGQQAQIPESNKTVTFAGGTWSDVIFKHAEHSDRYRGECIKCHDHEPIAGETHWYCRSCHTAGQDREQLCAAVRDHGCIMTQCDNCHKAQLSPLFPPQSGDCNSCHTGGEIPQGDVQAPTVPTGLAAAAVSSSQIDLSWTASTDNVAVVGYKIYRGGVYLTSITGTSTSDTGLDAGWPYCYQVSAYDAVNNESLLSTVACATTNTGADTTAPTIPSEFTAIAVSSSQINLSWTASTDNVAVVGYKIYRGGAYLSSVSETSTGDAGLDASTEYCYQVSAYDAANNESFLSTVSCATTYLGADTIAPTVPTGLTATAVSATQINLSWTASTDNMAVVGYKIYRGGVHLKSVSGTSTSDTGLNPVWPYCYQVSAYDAANNESYLSTVACATTQADVSAPTAPTGVTAAAVSSTQTNLSWTASTDNVGVVGYHIYRTGVYLTSVSGTSTSDADLPANTQYCYQVSAYDAANNESAKTQSCTPATLVSGTQLVLQDSVSQASDVDHWTLTVSTAGTIILDVQAWESCGAKPAIPMDFFGDGDNNNKLHANFYLFNQSGTLIGSATGIYPGEGAPGAHVTRSGQNAYLSMSASAGTYILAIGSYPLSQSNAWAGVNMDGSDWTNSYGGTTSYNKYKINITFN